MEVQYNTEQIYYFSKRSGVVIRYAEWLGYFGPSYGLVIERYWPNSLLYYKLLDIHVVVSWIRGSKELTLSKEEKEIISDLSHEDVEALKRVLKKKWKASLRNLPPKNPICESR